MKNFLLLVLLYALGLPCLAHDFIRSEKYIIQVPEYEIDWTKPPADREKLSAYLSLATDTSTKLQTIPLVEYETYDGYSIWVLENPKLEGIREVLRVEMDYFACCVNIDCFYYLITDEGEWIKLPVLENLACDGPEPIKEYRFPVQKFGLEQAILQTISFQNQQYQVDSIALVKKYAWDGKTSVFY